MRANPDSLELNYRFQDRRGLVARYGKFMVFTHLKFSQTTLTESSAIVELILCQASFKGL
jgi:hypothetical protein